MCSEILTSRGKEGGRAGGSGSREEPRRRSCGQRVGMGSGLSLLPGKQRTNSPTPSCSWGWEKAESHREQRMGQADPTELRAKISRALLHGRHHPFHCRLSTNMHLPPSKVT